MIKKLGYISILFLIPINVFFSYKYLTAINELKSLKNSCSNFENYKTLNKQFVVQEQLNNNIYLNKELVIADITNGRHTLGKIFNSGMTLIIRNSETGCGMCIEQELEIIKQYSKIIGNENIILFTTHNSIRKLEVFKKMNNLDFKMFSCTNLGIPFERESEKPFIFLMDSSLNVQHFFIPEVTMPELSEYYYSSLCKKYFNKVKS